MKKILFVAALAAFTFTSCNDDDNTVSCVDKVTAATEAAQTYGEDDSTANCVAYKEALENSLGCYNDQTTETAVQAQIDGLTCE